MLPEPFPRMMIELFSICLLLELPLVYGMKVRFMKTIRKLTRVWQWNFANACNINRISSTKNGWFVTTRRWW